MKQIKVFFYFYSRYFRQKLLFSYFHKVPNIPSFLTTHTGQTPFVNMLTLQVSKEYCGSTSPLHMEGAHNQVKGKYLDQVFYHFSSKSSDYLQATFQKL